MLTQLLREKQTFEKQKLLCKCQLLMSLTKGQLNHSATFHLLFLAFRQVQRLTCEQSWERPFQSSVVALQPDFYKPSWLFDDRFAEDAIKKCLSELQINYARINAHLFYAATPSCFPLPRRFLSRFVMLEFLIIEESSLRLPKDTTSCPIRAQFMKVSDWRH